VGNAATNSSSGGGEIGYIIISLEIIYCVGVKIVYEKYAKICDSFEPPMVIIGGESNAPVAEVTMVEIVATVAELPQEQIL